MIIFWKKKSKAAAPEKKRLHFFVSGRVQGVFFRESCKKKAEKLGLTGWVKNLVDGRVEGVLEGDSDKLEKMAKWAKRGPFWAKVEKLELFWEDYSAEFKIFEIKYDF